MTTSLQADRCFVRFAELAASKSVYIVTEVLKAASLTASLTTDDDTMTFLSVDTPITVGFAYKKFRLEDGRICEEVGQFFLDIFVRSIILNNN